MRIRNRKVPLPISLLCPVPISPDPTLSQSSLVQLQLDNSSLQNLSVAAEAASMFNDKSPSDQTSLPIGVRNTTWSGLEGDKVFEKREGRSKNSEEKCDIDAEMEYTIVKKSSSSSTQEEAFPAKKRREEKKMKTISEEEEEEEQEEMEESLKLNGKGSRKKSRGGALAEGSRCSRVNGRGWRCCQQTLVGYSLCEHHLGKGRLRSVRNVGSRSKPAMGSNHDAPSREQLSQQENEDGKPLTLFNEANQREEKRSIITKKTKLGVVKARSISSLLGLANQVISLEDGKH